MMGKKIFAIAGFLAVIFLAGFSSAIGIGSLYGPNNLPQFPPGSEGVITFWIQNPPDGDIDYAFTITLSEENGIARLEKDKVDVPIGSRGVPVNVYYKIPSDAPIGKEYVLFLSFKGTPLNRVGGIGVGGFGVDTKLPIKVIEGAPTTVQPVEKEKGVSFIWYLAIVLVIAGVVVYFVMRKKK